MKHLNAGVLHNREVLTIEQKKRNFQQRRTTGESLSGYHRCAPRVFNVGVCETIRVIVAPFNQGSCYYLAQLSHR